MIAKSTRRALEARCKDPQEDQEAGPQIGQGDELVRIQSRLHLLHRCVLGNHSSVLGPIEDTDTPQVLSPDSETPLTLV